MGPALVRRSAVAALVALVAAAVPAAARPTAVRVFHLQHASVNDASEAIQPLLSESGSLTIQPGRARITVQDSPEVVMAVAERLRELDQAPEIFRIEVELVEGTDRPVPLADRAAIPERAQRMFPFRWYRRIGAAVFQGELGVPSSAVLGGSYRVSFLARSLDVTPDMPWGIPDPGSRIHLEWLTLEQLDREAKDGQPTSLLRSSGFLSNHQEIVTGIGSSEDASNGLVLVVRSRPVAAE